MFNRKKNNWDLLRNRGYGDTAATRDVQGQQTLERGDRDTISNPWPRRIIAFVFALILGVLAFVGGAIFIYLYQGFQTFLALGTLVGISDYLDISIIAGYWQLWAFAGLTVVLSGLILYERLMAGWRSENSMADTTDINMHKNDQHVMLDEELQESLDWFPDAGAHSSIQVSSMLSHMMLSNKGLSKIDVAKRYDKDFVDDHGVQHYKGEIIQDSNGDVATTKKPLIDETFGQDLLTASGTPQNREAKDVRKPLDIRKVPYNPPAEGEERKKNPQRVDRDKLDYDTVGDLINDDWEFPLYEVQRPAGAYLVDTAPVNTMV